MGGFGSQLLMVVNKRDGGAVWLTFGQACRGPKRKKPKRLRISIDGMCFEQQMPVGHLNYVLVVSHGSGPVSATSSQKAARAVHWVS
jgi:hypothetical protein